MKTVVNEVDGVIYKTEIISERKNVENLLHQLRSEFQSTFVLEPSESELLEFARREHPYFELSNKIQELESWLLQ